VDGGKSEIDPAGSGAGAGAATGPPEPESSWTVVVFESAATTVEETVRTEPYGRSNSSR
jgi:hypothetical protein